MKITALEIAEKHNGTVEGDENILLTSLAKIQDAKKGSLSFVEKDSKYLFSKMDKKKINSKIIKVNHLFPKNFKNKIKNSYFTNINNLSNLKFILKISKYIKAYVNIT